MRKVPVSIPAVTSLIQVKTPTTMSSPQNLRRTFMKNWFAVEVGYLLSCAFVCLCADSFLVRPFRCEWSGSVLLIWNDLTFIQLCDYWRCRSWC